MLYDSIEELVETETNGYVAVAQYTRLNSNGSVVLGPFASKKEANNAARRLRRYINNFEGVVLRTTNVVLAWKAI